MNTRPIKDFMMQQGWFLLVGAALLACDLAYPAEPLSLEQAVHETVGKSPRLRASEATMIESQWAKTEALSGFLPRLSISGNHFFNTKYQFLTIPFGGTPVTIPQIYASTLVNFDAQITLFDGLQNVHRCQAASRGEEAAELNHQWATFQTEQEIRLRFYQALAAQVRLGVAEQNETTLEDHLGKVRALLASGVATRYDVLRVEVQLNESMSEKLSAQDNVVLARKRLAETMGLDGDERPLAGELPTPLADRVKDTQREQLSGRADLQARDLEVEAARKHQADFGAFWVPKINLVTQYQWYNNIDRSIGNTERFRNAYAVGLAFSWNLFDGGASYSRYRQAVQQAVRADALNEQLKLKAPNDLEFWKRRYVYSSALYRAKSSDVAKSEESVRLANLGLKAGTRTNTEVLDAELDLFRARAGAIQAQLDAAEALINLELAVGRKVAS